MCIYFSALITKLNAKCPFNFPLLYCHNKWEYVKICVYFSALTAKINAKYAFIFSLLDHHFEGTLGLPGRIFDFDEDAVGIDDDPAFVEFFDQLAHGRTVVGIPDHLEAKTNPN